MLKIGRSTVTPALTRMSSRPCCSITSPTTRRHSSGHRRCPGERSRRRRRSGSCRGAPRRARDPTSTQRHARGAGHRPRRCALRQTPDQVEPVFADTKYTRRIDRFQRRGRAAARSEWRLATAAHNLLKLYRHTTALQAAWPAPAAPHASPPPTRPQATCSVPAGTPRTFLQQPPRKAAARDVAPMTARARWAVQPTAALPAGAGRRPPQRDARDFKPRSPDAVRYPDRPACGRRCRPHPFRPDRPRTSG